MIHLGKKEITVNYLIIKGSISSYYTKQICLKEKIVGEYASSGKELKMRGVCMCLVGGEGKRENRN